MHLLPVLAATVWLCRPGATDDPCAAPRTATVVVEGKAAGVQTAPADSRARRFDCFYVYPTVSTQATANAGLVLQREQRGIAVDEASRFSQVCNVWSPVYRQITTAAQNQGRYDTPSYGDVAYASVLSAWRDYRAHHNGGRPIVFIGHSQGTQMISRLLKHEIESSVTLRRQVLLAILVGGNVAMSDGPGGSGSFTHFPACSVKGQTGCVIGYSLYNAEPPPNSRFGIPGQGASLQGLQLARTGARVVCTNPAALAGGSAPLDTYLRREPSPHEMAARDTAPPGIATPWVEYRGLFSAGCRHEGNATWLHVTRNGPANGYPRLSVYAPQFGLHDYDVLLPLGNLIDDVRAAEATYEAH